MFDPRSINDAADRRRDYAKQQERARRRQQEATAQQQAEAAARAAEHDQKIYEALEHFRSWARAHRVPCDRELGLFTSGWTIASYEVAQTPRADDVSVYTRVVTVVLTRSGRVFSIDGRYKEEVTNFGCITEDSLRGYIVKHVAKSGVPWK